MNKKIIYDKVYLDEINTELNYYWFYGCLNLFTGGSNNYLINIKPNTINGSLYIPFKTIRDNILVSLIEWQGIE